MSATTSIPDLGDPSWSAWYQSTFSLELAAIEAEHAAAAAKQRAGGGENGANGGGSGRGLVSGGGAADADDGRGVRSPASYWTLHQRLRAVDAMDGLLELLLSRVNMEPLSKSQWEPDGEAARCRGCGSELGWRKLERRHHCRSCGLVYCGRCATGSPRRCSPCLSRANRLDLVRRVRLLERDAFAVPSRDAALAVARAYRVAIEAFDADEPITREARSVLVQGLHSFLELDEIANCLKSGQQTVSLATMVLSSPGGV